MTGLVTNPLPIRYVIPTAKRGGSPWKPSWDCPLAALIHNYNLSAGGRRVTI